MRAALFTPLRLRSVELANRIVVSPMCQYSASDGSATDWHLMHLGSMAVSGFGLVFAEATAVERTGRITHRCLGLYDDANEAALARVVAFLRAHGGDTAFGIQLAHSGRKGSAHVPWEGGAALADHEGAWRTVAPSAIVEQGRFATTEALDEAGMAAIREAFVTAAGRAERVGLDVLELHAGHGYLMHEFLSPLANRRDDIYGGSLANRMRFPLSVFEAMRAAWPEAKPLGVRLSATDHVEGSWDVAEAAVFARELELRGCDFIDVSSGGISPAQKINAVPGHQVGFAGEIKRQVGIPVIAVGLIIDPYMAEDIVGRGDADLIAIARTALDDPRWAWQAARMLGGSARYPPQYLRCSPDVWLGRDGPVETHGRRGHRRRPA